MRSAIPQAKSPSADEAVDASPRVSEVTSEIGLILAVHLTAAFAIVLVLSACGIA